MMFQLLLGHLAGDYLFQNEWMAMNKSKNTFIGWSAAFIHCIIYTLVVCLFMWNFTWQWMLIVFLSHFPIDKFGLGDVYMKVIKGYGLKNYVDKDKWMNEIRYVPKLTDKQISRYDILKGGFTAVVYTITDNTMHLILMWIGYNVLYIW